LPSRVGHTDGPELRDVPILDFAIPNAPVVFPFSCRPAASLCSQVVWAWSLFSQTVIRIYELAHAEGETSTADAAREAVP
jgi:hypothetical protein